ncbi:hypothetical protein N7E02_07040 (plasmid) [Aliirhizobium terrae]|uniref:hypothetical protein n=1 Tax=Terrirhizobium terrae TaxID=2926709 RepID=UPI00257531CD|nr:hypothetical protein [Rhizobium sp. CC-CFT758]WJH38388.1 hypothetical protein N7E02_07040 [Rhizobium sp. CC-CFT758]
MSNLLSMKFVQPGLPTTAIFVFELPEDETRNMELVISEQYDPQLKDEIRVSLDHGRRHPFCEVERRDPAAESNRILSRSGLRRTRATPPPPARNRSRAL